MVCPERDATVITVSLARARQPSVGGTRRRLDAPRFLGVVGCLMRSKPKNLDGMNPVRLVAEDELPALQLLEQRLHVNGIEREKLPLDALGSILQAAIPIRQAPQPREAQPRPG